jgi:hypothetical protein
VLGVGVDRQVLDAGYTVAIHAVDGIASAAADADDLDLGHAHLGLRIYVTASKHIHDDYPFSWVVAKNTFLFVFLTFGPGLRDGEMSSETRFDEAALARPCRSYLRAAGAFLVTSAHVRTSS